MNYSNYHTHCFFCDGKGDPEDYIKKAISLKFHSLGFSSHAPVHLPSSWTMKEENLNNYAQTIKNLKEKYKNQIEIYCGLEIDYFESISGPDSEKFKKLDLDYTIGSVHFMKNKDTGEYLTVDGDEEEYTRIIEVFFKGNVQDFVTEYYGLIRRMLSEHKLQIVGHLDLIRKNNKNERYFNETEHWYKEEIIKTLKAIKSSGAILEVNTGAIARGYLTTPYPSPWILKECYELDIPITLNSDGHSPENLDTFFSESLDLLRYAGYRQLYFIKNKKWSIKDI